MKSGRSLADLVDENEPALSSPLDARIVARAMMLGRARKAARRRRVALALGSVLAAAAALALFVLRPDAESAGMAPPSTLALPSGDEITVLEGSAFQVAHASESLHRIRVSRGAILFDVRSRDRGAAFEVETATTRVVVVGTVFAVEVDVEGRTSVDVFEGQVELTDAHGTRRLGADERERSRSAILIDQLAELGRARAAARARASTVDPTPPRLPVPPTVTADPVPIAVVPAPTIDSRTADARVRAEARHDRAPRDLGPDATELRRALARGEASYVLGALEGARVSSRERAWLEADALRALDRFDEALTIYRAIAASDDPERETAGYLSARLLLREHRPAESIEVLDRIGVDRAGSPMRERGLALRARALQATGDGDALALVARVYLAEFPDGSASDSMRAVLASAGPR